MPQKVNDTKRAFWTLETKEEQQNGVYLEKYNGLLSNLKRKYDTGVLMYIGVYKRTTTQGWGEEIHMLLRSQHPAQVVKYWF